MDKKMTFEAAMDRLDDITSQLTAGDLPLDKSLKLFTESTELIELCQKKLDSAKLTIENLYPEKEGK